jgi:hypothetical protein
MVGTGIRYNPNTASGSVFGGGTVVESIPKPDNLSRFYINRES